MSIKCFVDELTGRLTRMSTGRPRASLGFVVSRPDNGTFPPASTPLRGHGHQLPVEELLNVVNIKLEVHAFRGRFDVEATRFVDVIQATPAVTGFESSWTSDERADIIGSRYHIQTGALARPPSTPLMAEGNIDVFTLLEAVNLKLVADAPHTDRYSGLVRNGGISDLVALGHSTPAGLGITFDDDEEEEELNTLGEGQSVEHHAHIRSTSFSLSTPSLNASDDVSDDEDIGYNHRKFRI